jgi:hypothetical protein
MGVFLAKTLSGSEINSLHIFLNPVRLLQLFLAKIQISLICVWICQQIPVNATDLPPSLVQG